MATQSSGFGAGRNNAERKAVPGSDTGGNSGDTAARPNVVSNINSNLMVQDKATKRWIPLQFDSTGGTGITVTLSGGAFRDAEGLPANVASAAAYGTSVFAARRDHVHTIAALTVTNAMIANTTIDLTAKVTGLLPMANGGSAANLTPSNGGIVYSSGTAMAILAGTAAAGKILVSQSSAAPVWSTPTFPATASAASGKTIRSDGTNWIASTATLSDAPSTALKWLRSDGTNWITSTATLAEGAVTSGKVLVSDGTNWVASTPTFPNASASAGKTIRSDGTNWLASTFTIPDTYTTGDTLYASATNVLSALAVGSLGQVAQINSSGIPAYDVVDNGVCEGRLTLTSGTPVTTADVTGATSIYFAPYKGNRIAVYSGSVWKMYKFTEVSGALGTLSDGTKPWDIFIYDNSGTLTLEFLVWTSTTARATALTTQDGVLVKSGATTRRYLGTFMPTSTTQTEDSVANRYLWNYYNRCRRKMLVIDTTASWTYSTATWRQARATAANQINFVIGWAEVFVQAVANISIQHTVAGNGGSVGIALDATNTSNADVEVAGIDPVASGNAIPTVARYESQSIAVGKHFLAWTEIGNGTATLTWFGATFTGQIAGLIGSIDA